MLRIGKGIGFVTLALLVACSSEQSAPVQANAQSDDVGIVSAKSGGEDNNGKIAMRDNCDPSDPAWAPTGGCTLKRGDVRAAEFTAFLRSSRTIAPNAHLIGHPSWRNEPSHLAIESGDRLRVTNEGGRTHTFTEVAEFGGGRVPPLNIGLSASPECATAVNVPPGARIELAGISDGIHRFICCIHPWMRATVRVQPEHHSM
jgi:plastocyanin